MHTKTYDLWQSDLIRDAAKGSLLKLNPRALWRNPVMLIVEMVSAFSTMIAVYDLFTGGDFRLNIQISIWLWFTVLFSTFSEALAEGRGRAQAESLRQARSKAMANRLLKDGSVEQVYALDLRKGDLVKIGDGETIPSDGEIVDGVARPIDALYGVFLLHIASRCTSRFSRCV